LVGVPEGRIPRRSWHHTENPISAFAGKVALVTGGTSGIGRSTALAFAAEGAKVLVTGRREAEGAETVRWIRAAGGEAAFFRADVSREADARAMVECALRTFGRLDVAFNNAGIEGTAGVPVVEQTADNYRTTRDINVGGVLYSVKYEIPAMLGGGGGAIVNNASVAGSIGIPGMSVYVASKHAVLGVTRSAALELAQQGVRINAVSPGGIETDMWDRFVGKSDEANELRRKMAAMHPMGRAGRPGAIAAAVVWLCSPAASFVTGADIAVDGGWTAQ
jgi:NAD(P)-dependent dehydrogenase (short-subunit alcohol dehydrogenase family)